MKRKILSSILSCVAITAITFTILVFAVLFTFFRTQMHIDLERSLMQIGAAVNHVDDPISLLTEIAENTLSEGITLIDADGTVLFDNRSDPAAMENHGMRAEILQASREGIGTSARMSATSDQQTYYYAMQLENGSFLRMSDTRSSVYGMINAYFSYFCTALILLCALAAAWGLHTTNAIVKPINKLNLDVPEENRIYPELEPLFARMSKQNRSIQQYIRTINDHMEEFNTITKNMAEGLILTSAEGKVLFINQSARRIFATEAPARSDVHALSNDPVFLNTIHQGLRAHKASCRTELGGRHYLVQTNPVFDAGHFTGMVILIPDITDQYLAEKNRREFTANVSHELKTPLTSIAGYAEIMKTGIADSKDWPAMVELIHKESTRMIRLVEDILYLSKLDSGSIYGDKEYLALLRLCSETADRFSAAAAAKQLHIEITGEEVSFFGYRQMTEEIISNLISNAVKYNRDGGSVSIHVSRSGGHARIRVSDTGIGISPGDQIHVFERFFRSDKSRSKATGGTGLGLSIVKHAVKLMNGTIDLSSTIDEGTCITVDLPLS